MGKHRERRSGEKKEEKEKKSDVEGRQNMLVPHRRPSDLLGRFLCAKGHNPLTALTSLSNLCITLPLQPRVCFPDSEKGGGRKRKRRKTVEEEWENQKESNEEWSEEESDVKE